MPSSESLNSRSKRHVEASAELHRGQKWWVVLLVVLARLVVGGVFIVSGVSKAIDVWGVMYKMQEYFTVWGMDIPRSLVLVAAILLSVWEALLGVMLLLGCYRRSAVWLMLLTMAGMLSLTLYIYICEPVADCGCFGDFLIISNAATFYKNILITGALIFLAFFNRKVIGLISPYVQWLAGFVVALYLIIVCLIGYNIQPMIDFRGYPEGTDLAATAAGDAVEDESEEVEYEFVYEKDGEQRTFTADNIPDSTWTFVDRRLISGDIDESRDFIVYDSGDDVTSEAIKSQGTQMLVLIPDINNTDISFTYYLNRLYQYLSEHGGSVAAVIGGDDDGIERWRDLSLAEYPLYTAEPTAIKEMARGNVALVYLEDGVIKWKRTASSVDGEVMVGEIATRPLDTWHFDGPRLFKWLTWGTVAILMIIILFNNSFRAVVSIVRWRRKKGKSGGEATNQPTEEASKEDDEISNQ